MKRSPKRSTLCDFCARPPRDDYGPAKRRRCELRFRMACPQCVTKRGPRQIPLECEGCAGET